MFSTANVKTDVVEAKHVLTAGPVARLVTTQARDSRAHASHTSREDFAKPVSLVPTCFYHLSDVAMSTWYQSLSYLCRTFLLILPVYNINYVATDWWKLKIVSNVFLKSFNFIEGDYRFIVSLPLSSNICLLLNLCCYRGNQNTKMADL